MKETASCNLTLPGGRKEKARISDIKLLGRGRAAEAWLVEVHRDGRETYRCVEKRFSPSGLTRFIYSSCFQSPFPYSTLLDSALCCMYRRMVARKILTWDRPDRDPLVADALYARLDQNSPGPPVPVLGTYFIDGIGLRPPLPEPRFLKKPDPSKPVNAEVGRLIALMRSMENRFIESGLVGSGWQVSRAALVTTANFLMTAEGRFYCVDLESGIPALLVPRYLFCFLNLGFPLFDNADCPRLRKYIRINEEGMRSSLGQTGLEELLRWVELLEGHQKTWKGSEIAFFRHGHRLLTDRDLRERVRLRLADYLLADDRIDEGRASRLRNSKAFLTNRDIFLSLAPASPGRILHRLLSNRRFRKRMARFAMEPLFRKQEIRRYLEKKVPAWLEKERITRARADHLLTGDTGLFRALGHRVLSCTTPRFLHRVLTDRAAFQELLALMAVALLSERFQYAYARFTILSGIAEWEGDRRLTAEEADGMRAILEKGEMQEYIRCFGMHLCLKLLEPLTASLKVIGASLFALQSWWLVPVAVLLIFNTSVIRTLYTLWRMLATRGRGYSYLTALLIGTIPAFGTTAYPFQMYRSRPRLSTFLLRDFVSRGSRYIPIYGGKHTLTEVGLLALSDRVLLVLAGIRWFAESASRLFLGGDRPRPLPRPASNRPASDKGKLSLWWNKIVDKCIRRLCPY